MLGQNKLLAIVHGEPMIRHVVQAALTSKIDEVIVVLGWQASLVKNALSGLTCRFIVNDDYEKGQSSSLKRGLREVGAQTRAILVLPGDIARIDSRSIDKVIETYNVKGGMVIVAAHQGRHGHPILFDRKLFPEIERITEESYGLKSVVKNHESEVRSVETGTENVLRDVDTPQDLRTISR